MKKVILVDATLRDGEQAAGVVFSVGEKVQIAKMLDEMGVDQIEVGSPSVGKEERETIEKIIRQKLKASIMAWNRPDIKEIEEAVNCGVDAVAISVSTSDIHIEHKLNSTRENVLNNMATAVSFAKKNGLYVSVNAEDASRTDFEFLCDFASYAKKAGADRLRFCDTVGILDPLTTFEIIKVLHEKIGIDIEIHAHNDFGMATANTIAAIRAGATHAGVTINGIGKRAGNAALEEVAMSLKYILKQKINLNTTLFLELAKYVAKASNREIPLSKPIIGADMFTYELGSHVDASLKNMYAYEVFDPKEVGAQRQLLVGKHSCATSVKHKFKDIGRIVNEEDADLLLEKVRDASIACKRALLDKELYNIYDDLLLEKGNASVSYKK